MDAGQGYDIGLGIELPATLQVSNHDIPEVVLDLELRAGRYVAARIEVTADPTSPDGITGEALREIPIRELIEAQGPAPRWQQALTGQGRRIIRGSDGPTPEVLQVVATAYRLGYAFSDSPTKEVMRLLGLPRSKVSRWLATARTEGLLSETRERQAGGVVDEITRQRSEVERLDAFLESVNTDLLNGYKASPEHLDELGEQLAAARAKLAEMEGEA